MHPIAPRISHQLGCGAPEEIRLQAAGGSIQHLAERLNAGLFIYNMGFWFVSGKKWSNRFRTGHGTCDFDP
jgi:hypothetical protein